MEIFKLTTRKDFGYEVRVAFLIVKNTVVIQLSLSWNDYASWPYFQLSSGCGRLLDFFFYAYKVGFEVDILGRPWG